MAALDAATGQHDAENLRVMIASGGGVDLRRAAELGRHHHQRGIKQAAAVEVTDEGGQRLIKLRHLVVHRGLDVVVMIPAAVAEGDEAHAGFDEAAGQQHSHAGLPGAVFLAQLFRLIIHGESGPSLVRGNHGVGALIEGIHAVEGIGFFQLAEMGVHGGAHLAALGEALLVNPAGQGEVADFEFLAGRIRTEAERPEGGAKVAGAGEVRGHRRHADVGREIVARTQLVRHHAAEAGELERRAGTVAGEHVVRAAIMISLAVGHGTDDGDLVRDLSRVRH